MAWLATVLERFGKAISLHKGWRPVRFIALAMLVALPLLSSSTIHAQEGIDCDEDDPPAECTDPRTPVAPTATSTDDYVAPELEPTYQTLTPEETLDLTGTAMGTATPSPTPTGTATPCPSPEATDEDAVAPSSDDVELMLDEEEIQEGTAEDPCANRAVDAVNPDLTATVLAGSGTPTGTLTATPIGEETVTGRVMIDVDEDGAISADDIEATGVEIAIYTSDENTVFKTPEEIDGADAHTGDVMVAQTTTDATGAYTFSQLQPAAHWLVVNPDTLPEEAAPGQDIAAQQIMATGTVDILLVPDPNLPTVLTEGDSVIGGLIFNDDNLNAEYEPGEGETGINDVKVTLLFDTGDGQPSADDIMVNTTRTVNGFYEFTELGSGLYTVIVDEGTLPANYMDGQDLFDRPDQNPRKVVINEVEAEGGQVFDTLDFAYAKDTDGDNVPDRKEGADDRDGDGIADYQDAYDPSGFIFYVRELDNGTVVTGPLAGVQVQIQQDGVLMADDVMGGTFSEVTNTNTVTTGADGSYRFELFDDANSNGVGLLGTESTFTLVLGALGGFEAEINSPTENIYSPANTSPFVQGTNPYNPGSQEVVSYSRIPTTGDGHVFYTSFTLISGDEIFNNHIPYYSTTTLGDANTEFTVSTTTEQTADAGGSTVTYTHTITNTGDLDDSYEIFIPTNTLPVGDNTGVADGIRAGYSVQLQLCDDAACSSIAAQVDAGTVITTPLIADSGGTATFRVLITPPPIGVASIEYDIPAVAPTVVRSANDPTVDQTVIDVLNLNVGCIEGRAYVDGDADGVYTEGGLDVPLGAIETTNANAVTGSPIDVFLSVNGSLIPTPINPDDDGVYLFEGFGPDSFSVQAQGVADRVEEEFSGFTFSVPDGTVQNATIPASADSQDSDCEVVDFRVLLQTGGAAGGASVSGFVYYDLDANGIFNDTVDTVASNVVVTITGPDLPNNGQSIITLSDGTYTITGLTASSAFTITPETLTNFTAVPASQVVVTGADGTTLSANDIRYLSGSALIIDGSATGLTISADGPDEVEPGEEFDYDIRVTNNTGTLLTGLIVDVDLDGQLDFEDDNFSGVSDTDGNDLTYVIASLASGASTSWSIDVQVDDDAEDGDDLDTDFTVRDPVSGVSDSDSVDTEVVDDEDTLTEEELEELLAAAAEAAEGSDTSGTRRPTNVGSASEPRNNFDSEDGVAGTGSADEDGDDSELPGTGYRLYPGETMHAVIVTAENVVNSPLLTILVVGVLLLLGLGVAAWGVLLYMGNAPGILANRSLWFAAGGVFSVLLVSVVVLRLLIPNEPGTGPGGFTQDRAEIPTEAVVVSQYPAPSGVSRQLDSESFVAPDDPAQRLLIPAISVDTELVTAPRQGITWDVFGFTSEVAHLDGTAFPGTEGNAVVAGHVRTSEGLSPFSALTDLEEGDVIIARGEEVDYVYTVTMARPATPLDSDLLESSSDETILTLITCSDWSTADWAYLMRFVVQAELTSVEPIDSVGR